MLTYYAKMHATTREIDQHGQGYLVCLGVSIVWSNQIKPIKLNSLQ